VWPSKFLRKNEHLLYILPTTIFLISLVIFPFIYSLFISFTRFSLAEFTYRFVGLQNYAATLRDQRFLVALKNTVVFVALVVAVEFFAGLAMALLLNRQIKGGRYFMILFIIPMMISPIVSGTIWRLLFDVDVGPINYVLGAIGFSTVAWITSTATSLISVAIVDFWQNTPFMMLVLLAGLQSLPNEPYEAALVDGASRWKVFRYITLPMLRPIIAAAILIKLMDAFKTFDVVYILTYGGPGTSSEVLSFTIYSYGFLYLDLGYASALSYILLAIVMLLSTQVIRRLG